MMGAPSLLFKLRNLGVQNKLSSELALRCANEFKASMSAPTLISARHKLVRSKLRNYRRERSRTGTVGAVK